MDEKMIQQIAREVLRRIRNPEGSPSSSSAAAPAKTLLTASLSPAEKEALREELGSAWILEETGPDSSRGTSCDAMLVAYTGLEDLAALAQCIPTDPVMKTALAAVFAGKKVILLEEGLEYKRWKDTCSPALYKRYQTYESMLYQWGVTIVSRSRVGEILGKPAPESCAASPCEPPKMEKTAQSNGAVMSTTKRLVTEREMAFYVGERISTLKVSSKTILTALALDMARARGIRVLRCKEGELK